jgi:hypothetical protein
MTARTTKAFKRPLAATRVARFFKETSGVEESHQVLSGLLVEFAGSDLPVPHGCPHAGRVVPQAA